MRTRWLLLVSTVLGLGAPVLAGTKVSMNIVPAPPDCFAGPGFCLNVGAGCFVDNSDCALATLSSKSKVTLDGKRKLKVAIKGVTDVTGALMTTGPAEATDGNPVLKLALSLCPVDTGAPPICDDITAVYLKVVLTGGQAKLALDLAPVLSTTVGQPVAVLGVSLLEAPTAGSCLGTNSTVDITTRLNDASCDIGIVRGVGGILAE